MSVKKGSSLINSAVGLPDVVSWRWTRSGGPAEQMFLEGTFSKLQSYISSRGLLNLYDSINIEQKNGTWYRMECARMGDTVIEVHRLSGTDVSQNIAYNLVLRDQLLDASAAVGGPVTSDNYVSYVSQIQDEVRKRQSGQQSYLEMQAAIYSLFGGVSTTPDFAFDIVDDIDRGGEQFITAQYTYTRSVVVAERIYQSNPGLFSDGLGNIDRIFSGAQLRSEESIPPDFRLPPSIIDNNVDAEWLKKPTDSDLQTNQRRCVTTKYLSADVWSRVRYKVASL
jgi:hypothetical protein